MTGTRTRSLLESKRRIGGAIRNLRQQRGWPLAELARHLDISVSRLSEIERGQGSFTAEQFLVVLRLFNVPVNYFVDESNDRTGQIQNALARLGARHLHESAERTPTELLHDPHDAIREALVEGSPRLLTALAPVLVLNNERLNVLRLLEDAERLRLQNRLGWIVANTLAAIDELLREHPDHPTLRDAKNDLGLFEVRLGMHRSRFEDVVDRTIRSERTLEQVRRESSDLSKIWDVVSAIQPNDFKKALEAAIESL